MPPRAIDHPGFRSIGHQQPTVERIVAHHLDVAALPKCFEVVAEDVHGISGSRGPLQRQPKQVEYDDAIAVRGLIAEGRLVADRDTMLVAADLATPGPERTVEQHLVGQGCLRNGAMGDAHQGAGCIVACWQTEDLLRFVDLRIGVLGEQHDAVQGVVRQG